MLYFGVSYYTVSYKSKSIIGTLCIGANIEVYVNFCPTLTVTFTCVLSGYVPDIQTRHQVWYIRELGPYTPYKGQF